MKQVFYYTDHIDFDVKEVLNNLGTNSDNQFSEPPYISEKSTNKPDIEIKPNSDYNYTINSEETYFDTPDCDLFEYGGFCRLINQTKRSGSHPFPTRTSFLDFKLHKREDGKRQNIMTTTPSINQIKQVLKTDLDLMKLVKVDIYEVHYILDVVGNLDLRAKLTLLSAIYNEKNTFDTAQKKLDLSVSKISLNNENYFFLIGLTDLTRYNDLGEHADVVKEYVDFGFNNFETFMKNKNFEKVDKNKYQLIVDFYKRTQKNAKR